MNWGLINRFYAVLELARTCASGEFRVFLYDEETRTGCGYGSFARYGYSCVCFFRFYAFVCHPLGIYTAVKQNTWFDYIIRGFTFAGVSVPNFWMGLMLLWIFALKLNLFPIVGGDVSVEI